MSGNRLKMATTKKRKRASEDAAAQDASSSTLSASLSIDLITAELRGLIAAAVCALALPYLPQEAQLHELLLETNEKKKSSAALLKLKPEARVRPGMYSSDLAVKLFYRFVKPHSSDGCSGDQSIATADAFAAALVGAMQQELALNGDQGPYCHLLGVSLPDADAVDIHGLHRDRILVLTREFAQPRGESELLAHDDPDLVFLYRDDTIAIIDKAANVLSVDGNSDSEISIQRRMLRLYPEARMVHRLDFETSGILVIALTRTAAQHLNAQFRTREVQKSYFAKVLGYVHGDAGTIELAMGPHPTEKLIQIVHEPGEYDSTSARWTKTEWRVVKHSPLSSEAATTGGDWTLMELKPITGKTHQLRVHMQHLGHPILGDSLYSRELVQQQAPRLCLHAAKIEIKHPVTNKLLTVESKCPF